MKAVMLDSDTLSEFLKNTLSVKDEVDNYLKEYDSLSFSIISYYEILNGLLYKDARKQLVNFQAFVEKNEVLPITAGSAEISANIRAELRREGRDIGHLDILIAGIAISNGLQLVTNNVEHFKRIKGLEISNWVK